MSAILVTTLKKAGNDTRGDGGLEDDGAMRCDVNHTARSFVGEENAGSFLPSARLRSYEGPDHVTGPRCRSWVWAVRRSRLLLYSIHRVCVRFRSEGRFSRGEGLSASISMRRREALAIVLTPTRWRDGVDCAKSRDRRSSAMKRRNGVVRPKCDGA